LFHAWIYNGTRAAFATSTGDGDLQFGIVLKKIGMSMKILMLPDGMFSLNDMPQFALSESQLRSELLKRGNDEYRVDDIIARAKRFLCR
jgi:hypothetical protein